jgi:hypothetical protein
MNATEMRLVLKLPAERFQLLLALITKPHNGGWQSDICRIFKDTHPLFSNLPVQPRKRPEQRRHRNKPTAAPTASAQS